MKKNFQNHEIGCISYPSRDGPIYGIITGDTITITDIPEKYGTEVVVAFHEILTMAKENGVKKAQIYLDSRDPDVDVAANYLSSIGTNVCWSDGRFTAYELTI